MQLDDATAAGVTMEAIGVLGHDRGKVAGGLYLRQCNVAGVRPGGHHGGAALARDQPVLRGILEKVLERRDLDRVVLAP